MPWYISVSKVASKDLSRITGTITIDKDHNSIKSATVLEYKDGKQVFNTKVNP
jgi:branched-chain amino acid transport system substrate-binding protein